MSRRNAWLALVFALIGLAASTASAYTHYRMLSDPTYVSFCDVSATWSCTVVYSSRFGAAWGVPVALFGAIWFAFAALLSVAGLSGPPAVRESAPGYLFAGSTLALAAVLYLGYASFFILGVKCPLCLITYAAVIGLFFVTGAATNFPMTSLPGRAANDLKALVSSPIAIVLALLFAGASATTLAFFPRESSTVLDMTPVVAQGQQSELERYMASQPRVPLVIPTGGAKVLIVKFNDYQCPACSQSYFDYKPIIAKYEGANPGSIRVVMKDFPLSPKCNATMVQELHSAACEGAVAVRLARLNNRGEAMEEWLYSNQKAMTPASVRQAAKDVGQVNDFDAKYAATLEQVKADVAMGRQLGVKSTPTFFINGVKVDGAWQPQFFDQAIAYEMKRPEPK